MAKTERHKVGKRDKDCKKYHPTSSLGVGFTVTQEEYMELQIRRALTAMVIGIDKGNKYMRPAVC